MKFYTFTKGFWKENPVVAQLLGLCPTLAVTTNCENALTMGLATSFVLISSSLVISALRGIFQKQIRIAAFTVIIATFVTTADYFLKAKLPFISKQLGPYVPLIVVNCLILGRQEAFASKNKILPSFFDAFGMGIGFTMVLVILGAVRELLGAGAVFGRNVLGPEFNEWVIMVLPSGAFITLGLLLALARVIENIFTKTKGK